MIMDPSTKLVISSTIFLWLYKLVRITWLRDHIQDFKYCMKSHYYLTNTRLVLLVSMIT